MDVEFSKRAVKAISNMVASDKGRIRNGIAGILDGDIVPLRGATGSYRLRVGKWRVIFSYQDKNVVLIEDIASRGQVYK